MARDPKASNREWYARKYREDPNWVKERNAKRMLVYHDRKANDPEFSAWLLKNKTKRRGAWERKYSWAKRGITPQGYEDLLRKQGGVCAICGSAETKNKRTKFLCVDHDHRCCSMQKNRCCGKCIRGLLCSDCNRALGLLGDNYELLLKAARYVRRLSNTANKRI